MAMGVPMSCRSCRRRLLAAAALFLAMAIVVRGRAVAVGAVGVNTKRIEPSMLRTSEDVPARRWLAGPGSSPPTCRARCGQCTPCRPVHVAIQPGFGPQWEYYPEVWRCKCGNKLFMP